LSHELHTDISASLEERYAELLPQIEGLVKDESDLIANLANISAVLKEQFQWLWVGFYIRKDDELVLGPFQGPVACTRIAMGKGVCGSTAEKRETIIVPDVDQFPGHIACSSASRSEIVVPLVVKGETVLVLDVDSIELDTYSSVDQKFLEAVVATLQKHF